MTISTKQKILNAAIQLFNKEGVANVRLQQIADGVGISVGNLAYHFKNKEAIVTTIYEELFNEFSQILYGFLNEASPMDFDEQLDEYHQFFSKYRFFMKDLFEIDRSYPEIMQRWRQFDGNMLLHIQRRIDSKVSRGVLRPESELGLYNTVANNIWMTIVFWMPQQMLKGQLFNSLNFKQAVWAHLKPYFTPNGLDEFKSKLQPAVQQVAVPQFEAA